MNFKKYKLLALCLIAAASIILAYIFGNQGIEAFFAAYIASGIVFTAYLWLVLRSLFATKYWLIVKLFGTGILLFVWAVFSIAILMFVFGPTINPRVNIPPLNWWVVVPSALALSVQVFFKRDAPDPLKMGQLAGRTVATLLTITLMFVAFVVFAGTESRLSILALVVAVQMQYIANYIAVETPYFQDAHAFINHLFAARNIPTDSRLALVSYALLLGAPFTLPLILILAMSKI